MDRIRQILLTQHIGAIAIGLIVAQTLLSFVSGLVQAGVTSFAIQQAGSLLAGTKAFSWTNLIASMISVGLNLLISLWLIRWLYFEPTPELTDPVDLMTEGKNDES
jgi:hypothetical protein